MCYCRLCCHWGPVAVPACGTVGPRWIGTLLKAPGGGGVGGGRGCLVVGGGSSASNCSVAMETKTLATCWTNENRSFAIEHSCLRICMWERMSGRSYQMSIRGMTLGVTRVAAGILY